MNNFFLAYDRSQHLTQRTLTSMGVDLHKVIVESHYLEWYSSTLLLLPI